MSELAAAARPPWPRSVTQAVIAAPFAVLIGVAAGNPTRPTLIVTGAILLIAVLAWAVARPVGAYLVLAASSILLPVVNVAPGRGLNPFDLLLPPILLASIGVGARARARAATRREADGPHAALHLATDRLVHAILIFYGIAVLSLATMVFDGRASHLPDSVFGLMRAAEGLLLFPIGLWWLRSEAHLHRVMTAMLVGGGVFAIVNTIGMLSGVQRAGIVWFVNDPAWPIDSPNEAATAMLLLIVLLLVRQSQRHQLRNLAMIGVVVPLVVLTFSRSGLLALGFFTALTLPRARWWWVGLGLVALAIGLPFVPARYWERLANTIVLKRGTFEAYSALIRVVCWKTAWAVFLAHPVLGVGYLGLSTVSSQYNDLRIMVGPAENYFLQVAADMGVPGLVGFGLVLTRLFQLGGVVRRGAPPGSLGFSLSRFHAPLLLSILLVCLVGDVFVGLVGLAQVALWTVLMVRAGHEAIDQAKA